ncbi:MAG: cytochrome b/b6 domain-containing protein [Ghiorsea sp.]
MNTNKYHPFLVSLHWLIALLLIADLFMGFIVLGETPNSDPEKILLLKMHMPMGIAILLLMTIRLITRVTTVKPADADIGHALLNKMAKLAHYAFYFLVILMALSGMATSKMAGLPTIVFDGQGTLPKDFEHILPHAVHGIIGGLLVLLILGHIAAALYHQFVRKDNLFSRIWFGNRD